MLEGRRTEVVAVFADLRGFTAFSAKTAPEEVMRVLAEYYEALGKIISQHQATLTSFSGDGLMILVNVNVFGGHDVDALLGALIADTGAQAEDVVAAMAGIAGYFTDACRQPPPPGLPTVRAFQRAQGDALRRWLGRRMEG